MCWGRWTALHREKRGLLSRRDLRSKSFASFRINAASRGAAGLVRAILMSGQTSQWASGFSLRRVRFTFAPPSLFLRLTEEVSMQEDTSPTGSLSTFLRLQNCRRLLARAIPLLFLAGGLWE